MTIALIEAEIDRFLRTAEPEILCLRGKWGVGKTYAWNSFLLQAKRRDAIAPSTYSYVSLFGLNALDQLKFAIFENSVASDNIGVEPSVESFKTNATAVANRLSRKGLNLIQGLPFARNIAPAFHSLSFLSISKALICFDDLERKSNQLLLKDVLGLAAHLRDQKKCKVAVILNDDALHGSDSGDFATLNEKVFDLSLEFAPDPQDCARIAINGNTPHEEQLRSAVTTLGISNIRIIKKVERYLRRVKPLIDTLHERVLRQTIQSLALLTWSRYSADAPTISFLKEKRGKEFLGMLRDDPLSADEKRWSELLDSFGFMGMDEYDLELLHGIQRGFFDDSALQFRAEELDSKFRAIQSETAFHGAWRLYHDSFDSNEDEVIAEIWRTFRENVDYVTPANFDGVVRLFKDLGRSQLATEAIQFYISNREETAKFFDLEDYPFEGEITDPDVISAFHSKFKSFPDDREPVDVLVRIADTRGWSRKDMLLLSRLSADHFYAMFKSQRGDTLTGIVKACLQLGATENADPEMQSVARNATEALVRIGRESRINYRRMKKFGVAVPDANSASPGVRHEEAG